MANTKKLDRNARKKAKRTARKGLRELYRGLPPESRAKFNGQRTKGKGLRSFAAAEAKAKEAANE